MVTARLHDDATIEVTVLGDGPAVLLPVGTAVIDGPQAEQMRAWGADPNLGHALATGLAGAGLRVIAADYEGHLGEHPKPRTLTAAAVAADLLAMADAAGVDRFAYYGYSWLAVAGLQLAVRTDRVSALAMGGYPPLDGPYGPMLVNTRAAHRMAVANQGVTALPVAEPGDWDAATVTVHPDRYAQFVTLYESLQDFDERAALAGLRMPRLAFAGTEDTIVYGPQWENTVIEIGPALVAHRAELEALGWTVEVVPGADHMSAMQARVVLPLLTRWLRQGSAARS